MFGWFVFMSADMFPEAYLFNKKRFSLSQKIVCVVGLIAALCYRHNIVTGTCKAVYIFMGGLAFAENIAFCVQLFGVDKRAKSATAARVVAVIMTVFTLTCFAVGVFGLIDKATGDELLVMQATPMMVVMACLQYKRKKMAEAAETASKLKKERERFARCLLRIGMKNEARSEGADISV